MTIYICSIKFNEETTADGGFDNELTLQEATIDEIYKIYMSYHFMPSTITLDVWHNNNRS